MKKVQLSPLNCYRKVNIIKFLKKLFFNYFLFIICIFYKNDLNIDKLSLHKDMIHIHDII